MKRLYILLIISFVCRIPVLYAQNIVEYDWGDAKFEEVPEAMYDTTGAYFLKSFNRLEMIYNDEGVLNGYQLVHQKIKINNNDALERFNKISFSLYSFNEIISLKARFIGKNGKVIELDKSHLMTIEDEDGSYKLLAMEGAEAGGIIEYFWVQKGYRNLFGTYVLQSNYPRRYSLFEITCPINLCFIAQSYNGAPESTESVDTVAGTRCLLLEAHDIPALRRGQYSYYESNLQRVEYTVAYNFANSPNRIYNWSQLAQYLHNSVYKLQPEEQKPFKTLVKKIKLSGKMTAEEKIRYIESYVKTNIQLIEDKALGFDISTMQGIAETKYADKLGYTRLFTAIFKHFNITFEMVITCDKTKRKFDKDFDGYNFMDDYLFYFPDIDNFIDPNSVYNRLSVIGGEYIGNDGLFFKIVKTNGIEILMPTPGRIPENDYTKSVHITKADVKLNPQEPSTEYTLINSFSGYTASIYQPLMHLAPNEFKQDFIDDFFQADKNSNKLLKWTVSNEKPADWFVKPLELKGTLSGNMLVSRAGNDLLFRIGELIGKQVEMYQEKEWKLPIEAEATRSYDRILTIDIPDGYKIANPEVLKMNVELIENGKVEAYFYSDYSISENQLIVNCTEGYKKIWFPVEKYSEYISVINAAADFNKIVLILRKN